MTPESSPVRLATEAYLNQKLAEEADQAWEASLPPKSPFAAVWPVVKVLPGVVLGIAVLSLGVNAVTVVAKEKSHRKCGADWLLWASGSNKTFETALMDKLEASRREFERQQEEANSRIKPFEIKEFDIQTLPWNKSPVWKGK